MQAALTGKISDGRTSAAPALADPSARTNINWRIMLVLCRFDLSLVHQLEAARQVWPIREKVAARGP
jgi:hypothetical protein